MGNIKIIGGSFDTKLELEHAGVAAGFPSPADEYRHETLDFNRDYIRHPEASFYGDVEGDSMKDAGLWNGDQLLLATKERANRMGLPCVGLLVDKDNPVGEALYTSVGFQYVNDNQWGGHPMKHLIL